MTYWYDAPRRRGDVVTIPVLWLAFVLSMLVHIAAMWELLPRLHALSGDAIESTKAGEPLAVRLAAVPNVRPSPSPPPDAQPSPARQPSPPPKARPEKPAPRAAPTPPLAIVRPSVPDAAALPPPAPPVVPAAQAGPPVATDLASFVAAKRRARGEPEPFAASGSTPNAPPLESDIARRDRIVAANLASVNAPTFGSEPKNSGGIFQIRRLGYDDAEFTFFGWNTEIKRRASQVIEVRKGDNSDILIAVIRRMIAIIRQYEQEDFTWKSDRLNRIVVLSARPRDNAGLEEFMMKEFFAAQTP